MNNSLKNVLGITATLALVGVILLGAFFWGQARGAAFGPEMMWGADENYQGGYGSSRMWGNDDGTYQGGFGGMMNNYGNAYQGGFGGMMGGARGAGGFGGGMMGGGHGGYNAPYAGGYGAGMMNNYGDGYSGGYGGGMMGGAYGGITADPLSLEANFEIVEAFLVENGWEGKFEIAEIMIFENHAYAQLVEHETGIGAYELLIDPATGQAYPEHGANMMWNLKYGMHSYDTDLSESMAVSAEEAVGFAQTYLDEALPGLIADDYAVPFYGYYTLHFLADGEIVGMLSVHGATGEILLHTWHGDFIEMSDHLHE